MGFLFKVNANYCYAANSYVAKNKYIGMTPDTRELPVYEQIKHLLPEIVWDGHDDAIACYNKVWEIGFSNLRKPNVEAGFVSCFIDTAFNDYLFMWDSAFILMFTKYASRVFDFQTTLDNFYSHQHKDGFICREICEYAEGEQWNRDDPCSTGPNVLPWVEWEYYCSTGDKDRLSKVFDPLMGYHKWLNLNRTWQDGTYWSSGNGCGMDNLPRTLPEYDDECSHGHMSWIDACAQMCLSANILINMAKELGREDETDWLKEEVAMLQTTINDTMWDDKVGFYFDKYRNGTLSNVKTVAPFWTLIANIAPKDRAERMVAHLEDENEFKRPNRVPALSMDHPYYTSFQGYWCGGVWAPTNYMIMNGLERYGYYEVARDIAVTYHNYIVNVFNQNGTVYEYYSPELPYASSGKKDFVGWGGVGPVAVLIEYVFGIKLYVQNKKIIWRVNCLERHGIRKLAVGDAVVDIICESRNNNDEKPVISVVSDKPITVEVVWSKGSYEINA